MLRSQPITQRCQQNSLIRTEWTIPPTHVLRVLRRTAAPERVKLNEAATRRTWLLCFIPYIDPVNWMRKHDHSLLSNAAALVICGLLAGLVVAAAAFPAIAVTALAAKAGADDFDNLPSTLRQQLAPQASTIYASDGTTLIATIFDENRHDVVTSTKSRRTC